MSRQYRPKTPKQFIEHMYATSIQSLDDRFAKISGWQLSSMISENLSGPIYVNELLQNADDAKAQEACFTIYGQYLIFTHNGIQFTEKDVEGISNVGDPHRNKVSDKQAIGNKGIGFKSVFGIADYALIVSGEFCFRFDKNHSHWKENPHNTPWQTIPIFTEAAEYPHTAKKFIKPTQVNFIFKLKSESTKKQIIDHIRSLKKEAHRILFLKHIRHFQFKLEGEGNTFTLSNKPATKKSIESKGEGSMWHITLNNQIIRQYIRLKSQNAIPEAIRTKASQEERIADKYRSMEKMSLDFAFFVDNHKRLIKADSPTVFCYLSTAIAFGLHTLVSSEFFLQQDRRQLQENSFAKIWNLFIVRMIFHHQFYQLQTLAKKGYWKDNLKLIAIPNRDMLSQFSDKEFTLIRDTFNTAKTKAGIVKTMSGKDLVTITNVLFDKYGFIEQFGNPELKAICIHPHICDKDIAVSLGAKTFDLASIITEIKKSYFTTLLLNKEYSITFWKFISELLEKLKDDTEEKKQLAALIKTHPLILSHKKELKPAKDIFINDAKSTYKTDNFISLLDTDLSKLDIFRKIGILEINLSIIIGKVNEQESYLIDFTRSLFMKFKANTLTKTDYTVLSLLKVKIAGGQFLKASECYLPDQYNPELPLQKVITTYSFVSPEYITDPESSEEWGDFFRCIGVKGQLVADNVKAIIKMVNQEEKHLMGFTSMLADQLSLLKPKVIKELKSLKILVSNGTKERFTNVGNGCYLSNRYNPKMPLESKVTTLSYVSSRYLGQEDTAEARLKWKHFFTALGVKETIGLVNICEFKNRSSVEQQPLGKEYVEYVDNWHLNKTNELLIPYNQKRYPGQQQFSYFCNIEYFDFIKHTPMFWEVLYENWETIQQQSPTVYKNTFLNVKADIPSCFYFYACSVIKEQYGVEPSEIYSPLLSDMFDDLIKTVKVSDTLSEEQLDFFGFKSTLSLDDAIIILRHYSKTDYKEALTEKIFTVYHHISKLDSLDTDPQLDDSESSDSEFSHTEEKPIALLTTKLSFRPAPELVFIKNPQLNSEPNERLIRKPKRMSNEDFNAVCRALNVTTIEDDKLVCKAKRSEKENNFQYAYAIYNKIAILAIVEADRTDKELTTEFINFNIKPIMSKLEKLQVILAASLVVSHDDLNFSNLSFWFDTTSSPTLYIKEEFNPILDAAGVLGCIRRFLELTLDYNDLQKIIYSNKALDLQKSFPALDFSPERIEDIEKMILKADTITNPKKRKKPEKEHPIPTSPQPDTKTTAKKHERDHDEVSSSSKNKSRRIKEIDHPSARPYSTSSSSSSSSKKPYLLSSNNSNRTLLSSLFTAPKIPSYRDSKESSLPPISIPPTDTITKSERLRLTDEQKQNVGRTGEQAVFDMLLNKYKKKYGGKCLETQVGLKILRADGTTKHVIWHNKTRESYKSFDFEIRIEKNGAVIKRRVIEVKSTLKHNNIEAIFSEKEWALQQKITKERNTTQYQSFFVFNTLSPQRRIIKVGGKSGHSFEDLSHCKLTCLKLNL